jgi:hypothetical protein
MLFDGLRLKALLEDAQARFGSVTPMNGFAAAKRSQHGVSVW